MALPLTEKLAALLQDGTTQTRAALIAQDIAETVLEAGQGGIADAVWERRKSLAQDILNNRLEGQAGVT